MSFSARICLALFLLSAVVRLGYGQPALQYADLGRCSLENGAVIQDCRIGYRTAGTLNEDRSNAILSLTWFTGTSDQLAGQLGPEGLIDTTRYFVVLVDALGNGVSASPSTSTAQPDSAFPSFSVRDMVHTQHRLLTEKLNIDSLHAVMGASMGGMQTFSWITQYPTFMDKAVPMVGTPRLAAQDRLLWRTELQAFRSADDPDDWPRVMKTIAKIHSLHLYTPRHLAEMDAAARREFVEQQENTALAYDPYDWAWQLKAMLRHDVTRAFDGSLSKAAAAVEAEVLNVTVNQDQMVHPVPAQRFTEVLGGEHLTLDSPCGHLGTVCEAGTIEPVVRRFLRAN